jgi:predicted PhzF superfamily epimerase YddE/YHI9
MTLTDSETASPRGAGLAGPVSRAGSWARARQRLPLYQVDAFAEGPFSGNPAAVVLLETWLPDAVLQAIAAENNLSETAFLVPEGKHYALRWFTPSVEVDLCGHATLAAGYVVLARLRCGLDRVEFRTREAGMLTVARQGEQFSLDLPSRPPGPVAVPDGLLPALGGSACEILAARDLLVVYERAADIQALVPDFAALARLGRMVIVTAPGDATLQADFVSRFFGPSHGVNEDPVTGSAHCTLVPYWAARLGRDRLDAVQLSARRGRLHCMLADNRVSLTGRVVPYLEGTIHV